MTRKAYVSIRPTAEQESVKCAGSKRVPTGSPGHLLSGYDSLWLVREIHEQLAREITRVVPKTLIGPTCNKF